MISASFSLIGLSLFSFHVVSAFLPLQLLPTKRHAGLRMANDDDMLDDDYFLTALRQRQATFSANRQSLRDNWLTATCIQSVVELPFWVRRVSVQWPLAACGSAAGDIFVVHCESGKLIAKGQTAEDQRRYADVPVTDEVERATQLLFGDYDGGGTLAIALQEDGILAHAGRDSTAGVEIYQLDPLNSAMGLVSLGRLQQGTLVTCLAWAQNDLWMGTIDGRCLVYTLDGDDLPSESTQEWKDLGGTVLSLSFHEDSDVAVVTTSNGGVEILSLDEPTRSQRRRFSPPFDDDVFPLCAMIVEEQTKYSPTNNRKFSLAVGGNDGSLFLKSLNLLNSMPELDLEQPFADQETKSLTPSHAGPCKCLASPFPGILLSGGDDSTIRIWDVSARKGLYIMPGLKVWLGSLWTDGQRLVNDGTDNAIMISDFVDVDDE